MKQNINESQLRNIIRENIKKCLAEEYGQYETGASTQAANELVLSFENTEKYWSPLEALVRRRLERGKETDAATLAGSSVMMQSVRSCANELSSKYEMKFTPADKKEAAMILSKSIIELAQPETKQLSEEVEPESEEEVDCGNPSEGIFEVGLWPGFGYTLNVYKVGADHEEKAIDVLVAYLIENNLHQYYMTEEEAEAEANENGMDVDEWEEAADYLYVDATMEGAPYPVYLNIRETKINKIR